MDVSLFSLNHVSASSHVDGIARRGRDIMDFIQRAPLTAPIARYIKSSHQNDPFRTLLELLLIFYVIRTWRQSRTPSDTAKGNIKLSEREVDELIEEWNPEPLVPSTTTAMLANRQPCITVGEPGTRVQIIKNSALTGDSFNSPLTSHETISVLNLSSQNFTGLIGEPRIKLRAVQQLRRSGVGSCGPPGFYGTFDVHMELERDIATFLKMPSSIIYAQGFSTASSVIPAFSKRGDMIVADRGVNFAIQKGIQISRSSVRWFDHNDMDSLERVLEGIRRDDIRYRRKLSRRFIITEGIFERDGEVCNLSEIIRLKKKYKFRLILDETWSIGALGRTGRGVTEHLGLPAIEVDMLLGSLATSFTSGGGFCAGSAEVIAHQRINSAALVFSAALPPLLATAASEAISILSEDGPHGGAARMQSLLRNISTFREHLSYPNDDLVSVPSDPASALVHIHLGKAFGALTVNTQDQLLATIVDKCLDQNVLVSQTIKVWEQEMEVVPPSLRLCLSSAMREEDLVRAASLLRDAFQMALQTVSPS